MCSPYVADWTVHLFPQKWIGPLCILQNLWSALCIFQNLLRALYIFKHSQMHFHLQSFGEHIVNFPDNLTALCMFQN